MRYAIVYSKVVDSIMIDAPYDTKQDAIDAVNDNVIHDDSRGLKIVKRNNWIMATHYSRVCLQIPYNGESIETLYNLVIEAKERF